MLGAAVVSLLVPIIVLVLVAAMLIALVYAGRNLIQRVNRRAMERVPVKISLKGMSKLVWRDQILMGTLSSPLTYRGFKSLGGYTIKEISSVTLQLLYNTEESAIAVLYEHPKVGHWVEITSFYTDKTTATYSTGGAGMVVRPGHFRVAASGLNAGAIFTRFRLERPKKPFVPITEENAQSLYLDAYADEATWRKANGKTPIAFAYSAGRRAS